MSYDGLVMSKRDNRIMAVVSRYEQERGRYATELGLVRHNGYFLERMFSIRSKRARRTSKRK